MCASRGTGSGLGYVAKEGPPCWGPLFFPSPVLPMGLTDKINAAAKSAEGHLQSAAGEISGDERMKLEGEGKQLQAKVMNAAGDLKDKAQDVVSDLGGKVQDVAGGLGEKVHDVAGGLGEKVHDVAGDLGEKVQDVAGDIGEKAKEAADAIGGAIGNALKGLHGKDS
jgi:uncharacterized protein YjbJ (UPF0337 family)